MSRGTQVAILRKCYVPFLVEKFFYQYFDKNLLHSHEFLIKILSSKRSINVHV